MALCDDLGNLCPMDMGNYRFINTILHLMKIIKKEGKEEKRKKDRSL